MALTVSTYKNFPKMHGGIRSRIVDVTFPSSYTSGGESFTYSDAGLDTAIYFVVTPSCMNGYTFEYDADHDKIIVYYADYDASADGALIEVADTTDLGGVTIRCLVYGV